MFLPFNATQVKNLFKNGDGLFHLVHQYNVSPANYAHESWFASLLSPDLLKALRKTRRGAAHLSKILLQDHGLWQKVCYNFDFRWWRFALLPDHVIKALALYCGLAIMHRPIAAVVDKAAIDQIKSSIGGQAYGFAVQRAPLIVGRRQVTVPGWDGRSDIGRFARQYGAVYFLSHFHDAPHAIAGRLAFKFSKPLAKLAVNQLPDTSNWHFFKRILVHEINPRWQHLFS